MTLYLHGIGHFHPENEITNRFLEELDIGTSDDWIRERVGIRVRRTALPLDYIRATRNRDVRAARAAEVYTAAQLGARAARLAIARAGLAVADIGLLLAGQSMPDHSAPAEACNVARELGLEVTAFDIGSACTSLLVQLHVLSLMRPEALPPYVLVVAAECATKVVDYTDRASAVLWGDGAAAAVVSTQVPSRVRLLGSFVASAPSAADRVVVPRAGYFAQDGRAVQLFAIKKTAAALEQLRTGYGAADRRLHFVGHQANLRVLEAVCARCAVTPERHHTNVEWFGNTAAASGPSVLSMDWERFQPGDDVALVGVGAGLTWAGTLVRFDAEVQA